MKTIVKLNGEVINIGDWDYQYEPAENTATLSKEERSKILAEGRNPDFLYDELGSVVIVAKNPMPAGAVIETSEVVSLSDGGVACLGDYKKLRNYPSIEDQLDYIYHNGIEAWKNDMIKPVKDAHPKT